MGQTVLPGGATVASALETHRLSRFWQSCPTVLRYAVAGGSTQVVYLSVLAAALATGLYYMFSLLLAQILAISYAFPVYRRYVFVARGPIARQFLTFIGIWWTGAVMSFVGVPLLVEGLGVRPFLAQLLVFIPVFTFSFLGHFKVTFRPRFSPPRKRAASE
jgi:putative flippase GtrA